MTLRIYDPIIVALDLRHRRFGYSVFEGHRLLLGWGVCVYPAVGALEAAMAAKRLAGLLKLYSPSTIVVTRERWERGHVDPHMRLLEESIMREALAASIPISSIGEDEVRASFKNLGCETRYETAAALSRIFPELVWKLPPKRRVWQSQHPRMIMFGAIALGLAYWQHASKPIPPPE